MAEEPEALLGCIKDTQFGQVLVVVTWGRGGGGVKAESRTQASAFGVKHRSIL